MSPNAIGRKNTRGATGVLMSHKVKEELSILFHPGLYGRNFIAELKVAPG